MPFKQDLCERINFPPFQDFIVMLSTWIPFVEINMRMRQSFSLGFTWSYLLLSFIMDIKFWFR